VRGIRGPGSTDRGCRFRVRGMGSAGDRGHRFRGRPRVPYLMYRFRTPDERAQRISNSERSTERR
jgi:hypothetical protein